MRFTNKQSLGIPINEKILNKTKTKNLSKSPIRHKQNNYNQYAVIEQAKRDFQKVERTNYSSNKQIGEKNIYRENYNSKNSDYDISKELEKDNENMPFAINQINSYVNKYENMQKVNNNNSKGKFFSFVINIKISRENSKLFWKTKSKEYNSYDLL